MAYLYARKNGRIEIREAHKTPRGPRSRTLVSFKGALTEQHLERAESATTRTLDRVALRARAVALGVPVDRSGSDFHARQLIAALRGGATLNPTLVTELCERLERCHATPVPDELCDAIEWIGASDRDRGRTLRDLLRLYGTIVRSRAAVREPERVPFPRFSIRPDRRAS